MNKQDLYQQLVGSKAGGGSSNPVNLSSREELYNSLINANKPSASNKVTVKKTIKKPQATKKEAPKGIVNRLTDTVKYGAERFKASFPTLAGGLKVGSGVALDSIGKTITDGAFDERNKKIKIDGKEMTVREAIGKTAPSFIPSADPDPFRRAKIALEKKTGKDLNVTKKLKESGSKDYKRAQEASQKVIQKYGTPEKWTGKWLVGEIGGNAISTIGSVILGVATTAVTKNPVLGLSVGMSNTFMQESGSFYSQAKEEGASEADAQNGAVAVGTINSFIETIPLGRALSKFDSSGNIKKKLLSRISGFILKKVKNSTFEGSTETVQEIVSNAMKKTYKEDTKLFENTPESFAIGFSLGIVGDLTTDPITSNIEVVSPRKVEETNEIIDEALNTPKEERTPEQQQVVDSVNEKLDSMDVSEPQETVEEKDEKKATKVEETKAPADRADNVTKAPEPAKTIAKAETDPLITEARKYKSADEFMSNYKKVFHQTSPESAQAIEKEGFKTGIKGSGYGDFLPEGINTKSTGGEIPLRGRGMQIEAFFDSKSRVQRVKDRDGATRLIIENDKSGEYEKLLDEMDFIDNDAVRRVDALEKEFHDSRGATRVPGERDAYFKSRNIDLQKMLQEGSDKSDEVAQRAKKVATRVLRDMGVDVLHIEKDVGGWSGKLLTDNFIVLNPKALKTKSQLTDIWNQAQPTKGVDPLIEEARKYKSAEEFVNEKLGLKKQDSYSVRVGKEGSLQQEFNVNAPDVATAKKIAVEDYLQDMRVRGRVVSSVSDKDVVILNAPKNGKDLIDFKIKNQEQQLTSIREKAKTSDFYKKLEKGHQENLDKLKAQRQEVSQLTDIWNQAQPTKGVDPLLEEARKYKSAEEFVKAQGQSVFRGGDTAIDTARGSGRGISVSDKETAGLFTPPEGGLVDEAILPKTAKILKEGDIPKNLQDAYIKEAQVLADPKNFSTALQKSVIEKQQAIIEYARKNGFDAVDFPFEKEIRVVKPNVLKTKSQLIDIWNQAQTDTISEADKKDFEDMGLKVPEDAKSTKTTTIPEAEKQIQDTYTASQDKVDQAFSEVFAEMEIAEAGRRIFLDQPDSSQRKVVGVKSTFPDWIPEDLRSRKLFDAVMGGMSGDVTKLKFPDKNKTKQRQLYNEILAEVDKRSGVDTSEARSAILDLYEKPVQKQEAKQATKPADRSSTRREETTAEEKLEEKVEKYLANRTTKFRTQREMHEAQIKGLAEEAKRYETPEDFYNSLRPVQRDILRAYGGASTGNQKIYAFYARVTGKKVQNRAEDLNKAPDIDYSLESDVVREYGITDNPDAGAFITSDGEFINGGLNRVVDHREMVSDVTEGGGTDGLIEYMAKTTNIRIINTSSGEANVDLVYYPNNAQMEALMSLVEGKSVIYADVSRPDGTVKASGEFSNTDKFLKFLEKEAPDADTSTKFRVKDDVAKITGKKITDEQEAELIALNKRIFGDDNVKITLQIMANKKALGAYQGGIIQVLDGQVDPKETLYHEAVHKYIDVFTTRGEQVELFKAGIEKYGTDDLLVVEEKLAEDFISYAKSREGITGKIKSIFDSILARINAYLGNADAIDKLYQDILSPAESKLAKAQEAGLPVGQGKTKESAFLERVKEQLLSTDPASYEFDEQTGKYNEMNLEENAQRATDFIVSNPKEAIAVSLGLINPPQGVTANAIGLGTMLKARDEKNFNLYRDIATSVTLRSTRLGQEIVSLRGQMNDNSPENFVKRAINARMKNISKSLLKDVEVAGRSLSDTKKEVTKKIDEETVKLKKKLSKDKIKIQKAQDIIDALRC